MITFTTVYIRKGYFTNSNFTLNFKVMFARYLKHFTLITFLLGVMVSCVPEGDLDPDSDDDRDKFVGTWRFDETKVSRSVDAINYTVTISYDPGNTSQVLLRNFANVGGSYSAYGIVTSNRITIPSQEITSGFRVSGSGTMSNLSTMSWEYTIIAGSDMESFTAVATK
jgi:hypothetical protein